MNDIFSQLRRSAIVIGLMTLSGVAAAANPIANEKIAVAKSSLQRAESAGATENAPVELAAARDKLARAERALADRNKTAATQWAEQADVDAQLAEATAQQQKSHKAAMDFDASMQALRQEAQRSGN